MYIFIWSPYVQGFIMYQKQTSVNIDIEIYRFLEVPIIEYDFCEFLVNYHFLKKELQLAILFCSVLFVGY